MRPEIFDLIDLVELSLPVLQLSRSTLHEAGTTEVYDAASQLLHKDYADRFELVAMLEQIAPFLDRLSKALHAPWDKDVAELHARIVATVQAEVTHAD